MKLILCAIVLLSMSSCSFAKSEEAIVLKIDTATVLRGRLIEANIKIDNSEKTEIFNYK